MNKAGFAAASGIAVSFLIASLSTCSLAARAGATAEPATLAGARQQIALAGVPFMPNTGQWDAPAAFAARTLAGTLFVTTDGKLVYHFPGRASIGAGRPPRLMAASEQAAPRSPGWSVTESFVDAQGSPIIAMPRGAQPAAAKVSYFRGGDASQHRTGIGTYDRVSLGEVFAGIDVQLRATGHNVEKVFTVAPGQDPRRIHVRLDGATRLEVGSAGELIVHTGNGPITYTAPIAYQEDAAGHRTPVDVGYNIEERPVSDSRPPGLTTGVSNTAPARYAFAVGAYDPARALVIDPLLQSTYLGGSGDDRISAIAIHPHTGEVYVTGSTPSTNFPQTGSGAQPSFTGTQACFISRLSADLSRLIGSTYLGNGSVRCTAIAIHPADGRIYVAGNLGGTGTLPALSGSLQTTFGGGGIDGFVSVLDADLATVVHSTFLGGTGGDAVKALAIHPVTGYVYVAGSTSSTVLPGTAVGTQPAALGNTDGFIARLRSDLATPATYTFIASTDFDSINGLAVDLLSGDLIAIGQTYGTLLASTLVGAAQTTIGGAGNPDAFVTRLRQDLSAIVRSTYLGGTDLENPSGVAVHPLTGDVYVSGVTGSSGTFPVLAGGAQSTGGGGFDLFVSRLRGDLGAILQSTYLGGGGNEAVDGNSPVTIHPVSGEIYVAASTNGSLPAGIVLDGIQSAYGGDDVLVARLDSTLTHILQATYLGGGDSDIPGGIAVDPAGSGIFVAGYAGSGFPTVAGAAQPAAAGDNDGFISRLSSDLTLPNKIPAPFTFIAQSNVPPGTLRTSNEVKILGTVDQITAYVTGQPDSHFCDTDRPGCCVKPTPAPYCDGAYISDWITSTVPGFGVFNNDYISVRHTSPAAVGTAETKFIMGGVATPFRTSSGNAAFACNLDMDGDNKLDALKEGLVLMRAMFGLTGTAVTAGTGIATPWAQIQPYLNTNCGTNFAP